MASVAESAGQGNPTLVLSDLIAKLEGESHGSVNLDIDVLDVAWPDWKAAKDDALYFITSSADAALALIERVLDVWCISLESTPKSDHPSGSRACAQIHLMGGGGTARVAAPTPALALCIACLKALQSIQTEAVGGAS